MVALFLCQKLSFHNPHAPEFRSLIISHIELMRKEDCGAGAAPKNMRAYRGEALAELAAALSKDAEGVLLVGCDVALPVPGGRSFCGWSVELVPGVPSGAIEAGLARLAIVRERLSREGRRLY